MAHNFCVKGMVKGLQPNVAMAGYIHPTAKLETKKAHLVARDKGIQLQPLDLLFDPDPSTDPHTHAPCPFSTVTVHRYFSTAIANADSHLG